MFREQRIAMFTSGLNSLNAVVRCKISLPCAYVYSDIRTHFSSGEIGADESELESVGVSNFSRVRSRSR